MDTMSGRKLGGFVLRDLIARGGFGTVYRAEDELLARDVAIKLQLPSRGAYGDRLQREACFAARVDHPFALQVYAFGVEPDGVTWMAMELVRGRSLKQWIAENGPIPLRDFLPAFECVCELVQEVHEAGLIHGDVKASNIMVVRTCGTLMAKLIDFGCAVCAGEPARGDVRPGVAQGSPKYMAPEQWETPGRMDGAVDIYSLGVVAYEALTGRQPFTGPTTRALCLQHAFAAVPSLGPGFDPALDAVIAKAMAKRPDDRWPSAGALAAALREASRSS